VHYHGVPSSCRTTIFVSTASVVRITSPFKICLANWLSVDSSGQPTRGVQICFWRQMKTNQKEGCVCATMSLRLLIQVRHRTQVRVTSADLLHAPQPTPQSWILIFEQCTCSIRGPTRFDQYTDITAKKNPFSGRQCDRFSEAVGVAGNEMDSLL
jgi:hypothetical protein